MSRVTLIDEVGYLNYDNRYADVLFEVVTRRYLQRPTIITTNKKCGAPHFRVNAVHIVMQS
jgi:DNA replication protein DnaC